MDASISAIITKALDGLAMRSVATAQNIANINSPNYRPLHVSFENELRAAVGQGVGAIHSVTPDVTSAEAAGGNAAMRADLELATASETAMRYGALIDVLGRELQLQHTIIRGGQ